MSQRILCVIFMTVGLQLFAAVAVAAPNWQSHEQLQLAARKFIEGFFAKQDEIKIHFGTLDKRLRLEVCREPLQPYLSSGHQPPLGATNIGLRCPDPDWKVHIPARVSVFTEVLTAKHPIVRGSIIGKDDLILTRRDAGRFPMGVFREFDELVGMVARRSIRDDAVITPQMVKPRRLVSRGELITIVAEANGLQIRTSGKALMDGHRGQMITVKNVRSGRTVSGEVIARSVVRVKM